MNKELIIKYKAEFDHWLNGGKLFIKMSTGWEPVPSDYVWHLTDKLYVINDEYVELRKALAEGKIIQLNEAEKFSDQNRGWVDLSCTSLGSSTNLFPVEYYRIKPEEPKFKVGDWVRDGKNIYQFIEPSSIHSYESSLQRCELWQPKPGEFCWFWNEPSDIPILAKLISIEYFLEKPTEYKIKTPSYISETVYSCMTYMYFKNCEPFIGQLPTNLKDSK